MLYAMQDASQRALAPVAMLAGLGQWLSHAMPFMPASLRQTADANFSLLRRLTKTYGKPEFGIREVTTPTGTVAVSEEVVLSKPFCELRHFVKDQASPGPRLLIVAPLSGHHATLLRGTVAAMLQCHDVYITDWTDARRVALAKGKFDLSDYVSYVQEFIRMLGEGVHVLAVCQPCVPTLAAVSLMEQNKEPVVPKSLTLIAGPVDTRFNPTAVNRFATERDITFFRDQLIERVPFPHPGVGRKVYPGFMQLTGFVMMNRDKHTQAYHDYHTAKAGGDHVKASRHEEFYDEYNAVLDMTAEYYLETIEKVFMQPQLAMGTLELCGQQVRPNAVRRVALLTVEGDKDDITGLGQTHVAHELCKAIPKSRRAKYTIEGVGHYGAFCGSRFTAHALPVINRFIARNA